MNSKKMKKIIFSIVTAVAFFVLVVCNFYAREAYAISIYFMNSYMISDQIFSGDVVEQEFTLREGDEGFGLMVGTYVTTLKGGTAVAELYDMDGNKVAETEAALEGITDNTYIPFLFEDLDESLYGQKLNAKVTFHDIDDELIALFSSATDTELYKTSVNGEERPWNMALFGVRETVYWEYHDFRRFYVFAIGVFALYMSMFKIKWKELNPGAEIKKCKDTLKENWKKIFLAIGILLGCAGVGAAAEYFISANSAYANPFRAMAIAVAIFIVIFAIVFKDYIWKKIHWFFFMVVMLIGAVYIFSQPPTPVSHDEQIHYTRTSYLSWGATDRISISDYLMLSMYTQKTYVNIFEKESRLAWIEEVNVIDGQGGIIGHSEIAGIAFAPYMITSIVFYVLRLLQVDFITRYIIGKLINLLLYAFFFSTAIKLLKGRGKLLVAMVGLVPTNILMACSYGYDWWVVALVALGYAMFIGELQSRDKISTKRFLQSTGLICIGMLPKPVYFPMLLPMMLLKKERYEESKKCRWITVLAAVALVASFIIPLFISVDAGAVAGGGDNRGGTDVNAAGQIVYILTNLGAFLKTLFMFMWEYLNPDKAYAYLTATAYQGVGPYYTVCFAILGIVALMDNTEELIFKKKEPLAMVGGYIGIIGAIVLVVMALYISYTPVGFGSVNGCQPRYLLPVLFPFLYFAGENKLQIPEEMRRKIFLWGTVVMALIFLLTVHNCFIIKY